MNSFNRFIPARRWPLLAALAAALMLAGAHAFETFGGYPPCELCLRQRDGYWIILAAGLGFAAALPRRPRWTGPACAALAVLFLAEAGLAAYHAGVEWRFWPGPPRCTGAGAHVVTAAQMAALLSGQTSHVVQCDVAAFRLLGVSMAGWNAVGAFALSLLSLYESRTRTL